MMPNTITAAPQFIIIDPTHVTADGQPIGSIIAVLNRFVSEPQSQARLLEAIQAYVQRLKDGHAAILAEADTRHAQALADLQSRHDQAIKDKEATHAKLAKDQKDKHAEWTADADKRFKKLRELADAMGTLETGLKVLRDRKRQKLIEALSRAQAALDAHEATGKDASAAPALLDLSSLPPADHVS